MEINSDAVAAFPYGDMVVYVRRRADEVDRAVFDALTKSAARALLVGETPRLSRDLARVFVCGWAGVMFGQREVQYSWQLLEAVLPQDVQKQLHQFVLANVDILKQ